MDQAILKTILLLKKQKNGEWNMFHHNIPVKRSNIWSFGYDKKNKKIFISQGSISQGTDNYELKILTEPIKLNEQLKLCKTTMPNGSINNSGCIN